MPQAAEPNARGRVALIAALLALCAYAAFARGAVGLPQETWLELGIALLATVVAGGWLGARSLRPAADPVAVAGLVLLLAFAAWVGASLIWSVAPEDSWQAFNRAFAYVLVVACALVAGSVVPRAVERVAAGWLVVAMAVALYALGGKVLPGVLHHANEIARLRAPLEYWNALGLVCVLGAAPALRFVTATGVRERWRVASLVALFVLLSVLGMTYSRGGVVALVIVVVGATALGGRRIEALIAFALAGVATAPVLAIAYTVSGLADNAAPHDDQVRAGLALGAAMLVIGVLLALAGRWLIRHEHGVRFGMRAWGVVGLLVVAATAAGVTALAVSDRGLGGSVDRAVDSFTEVRRDRIFEPGRLLSTSSGNRWAWWREAGGAFADEPVVGWGAGSFAVSRRLYRVSPYDVRQPHSLPMQLLAETGVIGALTLLAAFGLLGWAALRRLRSLPPGPERDLAGALIAACLAWFVHAGLDWDWDIPGVTLPVLVFLGVLGARTATSRRVAVAGEPESNPVARWFGLAAVVLALVGFAASAVLPVWSDAKADDALEASRDRSPASLEGAAADADLARRLDPVAARPLFAAAAIAEGRGRLLEARDDLLEAVDRQPWSLEAWRRLIGIAVRLADREGVREASRRALELDPGNPQLVAFVRRAQGVLAPPEASATATGTPLAPPAGAAPPATTPATPGTTPVPSATGGAAPVNPPEGGAGTSQP